MCGTVATVTSEYYDADDNSPLGGTGTYTRLAEGCFTLADKPRVSDEFLGRSQRVD